MSTQNVSLSTHSIEHDAMAPMKARSLAERVREQLPVNVSAVLPSVDVQSLGARFREILPTGVQAKLSDAEAWVAARRREEELVHLVSLLEQLTDRELALLDLDRETLLEELEDRQIAQDFDLPRLGRDTLRAVAA